MKTGFATLTLATLAVTTPAALHAQNTQAIVRGYASITLTPAVLQQLAAVGVTVSGLSHEVTPNGTNLLPALEGVIDLDTSANEVIYGSGYQIAAAGTPIQIRDITLELSGPSAIFYGIVVENTTLIGREPIFSISASGPPALPIVPVNGTISHNGLNLSFEQPFISLLNSVVGNSGLDTTSTIGTLDLYSVLAPLSGSTNPYPNR